MGILDEYLLDEDQVPIIDPTSFIKVNQRPGDLSFNEIVNSEKALRNLASHDREYTRLVGPDKEKPRKQFQVDAPFLGFTTSDYNPENVFAPQLENISTEIIQVQGGKLVNDAKVVLFLASKGAGKSVAASVYVDDEIIDRYNRLYGIKVPCVEIDPNPQAEWYIHRDPITSVFPKRAAELTEFFRLYGRKPRGYTSVVYASVLDQDDLSVDKPFCLSLRDFLDVYKYNPTFAKGLLADLLGIPSDNVTDRLSLGILMKKNEQYGITNFERLEWFLSDREAIVKELRGIKPTNLYNYTISARDEGLISDSNDTSLPELVTDILKYDKVILRVQMGETSTNSSYENQRGIYSLMFIEKFYRQLRLGFSKNQIERSKSLFNRDRFPAGMILKIDECEHILTENASSYIKIYSEHLGTKGRKAGLTLVGISQYPDTINQRIVGMSDLKFVSTVDTEEMAKALANSGVSKLNIRDKLMTLKQKVEMPMGLRGSQWELLEKRILRGSFFFRPPESAIYLS